jgi:hypothetical protein
MQDSLSPEEIAVYQRMQDKIDQELVKLGAIKSPATDSPATAQSPSSAGTTRAASGEA